MADAPHNEPEAFVIGDPIAQSKSPIIHGHWLHKHELAGRYDAQHVRPEELSRFLGDLAEGVLAGGNVTVPHKEETYRWVADHPQLAEPTPMAARLKAVNTLYRRNGKLVADNTDGYGFAANLDQNAPGWDDDLSSTLIIGAGGASRAVAAVLDERRQSGDRLCIVNRTQSRAQTLADDLGLTDVSVHGLDELPDLASQASFAVNTTSLGMSGSHAEGDDVLLQAALNLRSGTVATDIVYVPLQTPFLQAATDAGARTVDGLGMLLHQAVPGFEAWFGVRPEVTDELRQLVLDAMAAPASASVEKA